jgi:hypothetical protein
VIDFVRTAMLALFTHLLTFLLQESPDLSVCEPLLHFINKSLAVLVVKVVPILPCLLVEAPLSMPCSFVLRI